MKILSDKNVFDAALERINFLFDEFPNVVVGISGGKDSTTVFELTMRVARERKRLPLTVFFIDQEAEWTFTIDIVRAIMHRPDVRPLWMQMPINLENATSYVQTFLKCWDPECEDLWIHPRDPVSIKENRYGTVKFSELFEAIFAVEYAGQRVAVISGVRCEESPARNIGLTQSPSYKWVTWAKRLGPGHVTFYPLYDWSYVDVWHAIQSNQWPYNRIYDYQYRYGMPVQDMRVSNLHHETALRCLFYLQEVEPILYERIARRLPGVDTAGKLQGDFYARKLPFMFRDWCEYRDYLIEKLVAEEVTNGGNTTHWKAKLKRRAATWDDLLEKAPADKQRAAMALVQSILCNDHCMTKAENFRVAFIGKYRRDRAGALAWENDRFPREKDPQSFDYFQRHIQGRDGVGGTSGTVIVDAGRSYFLRDGYRHWIEGTTLCREEIVK